MNEKLEGYFVLSGLLQGRLTDVDQPEDYLEQWAELLKSCGLQIHVSMEGDYFSLLPEQEPVRAEDISEDPSETVRNAVEQLVDLCAHGGNEITSTLHSVEYKPGKEIQTAYAVREDGSVDVRQREVEAETTPPPRRRTLWEKARLALLGLGIALLAFMLSAQFVDYSRLLKSAIHQMKPIEPERIDVGTDGLKSFLEVTGKDIDLSRRVVILEITRRNAFPTTQKQMQQLSAAGKADTSAELVTEAIRRGYIRCEIFDETGEFMEFHLCRIKRLRTNDSIQVEIPLQTGYRPGSILLTY